MNDPYSKQVRRMLTISQFQSKELAEMYTKRYVETMLNYDEKLFSNLMERGVIMKGDSKTLARMFYAPVIMYMGIWDREPDRAKECEKEIKKHVEEFVAMTKELTEELRKNRTIDWNKKETSRAKMRVMIKRLLKKYKYPPEGQEQALETVMAQCNKWADDDGNLM